MGEGAYGTRSHTAEPYSLLAGLSFVSEQDIFDVGELLDPT